MQPRYHGDVWWDQPRFFPCSAEKVKKAREEEDNQQTVSRLCWCMTAGEDNAAHTHRCGRWGVEAAGEKLPKTGVTVTEINPAVSRQGALILWLEAWGRAAPGCLGKQALNTVFCRQKNKYKVISMNKEKNSIKQHVDCCFLRSNHCSSE